MSATEVNNEQWALTEFRKCVKCRLWGFGLGSPSDTKSISRCSSTGKIIDVKRATQSHVRRFRSSHTKLRPPTRTSDCRVPESFRLVTSPIAGTHDQEVRRTRGPGSGQWKNLRSGSGYERKLGSAAHSKLQAVRNAGKYSRNFCPILKN